MKKSSRFASFFCLFSTLLVTSCGKSLEQSTEELNKVFKALSNLEEISVVFTRNQDDVDSVQSLISIMDSEEGLEILKKSNLKEKFLTPLDSVSSLAEFFGAEAKAVGEEVKAAKPSKEELQTAYDKLGDMHIKYVVILEYVSNPSGKIADWNRKMMKFSDDWNEFEGWWNREMR